MRPAKRPCIIYEPHDKDADDETASDPNLALSDQRHSEPEQLLSQANSSQIVHHVTQPHECMPPELWQSVFLYIVQSYPLTLDAPGPLKMLLRLSNVCQFWRKMTLTNPALWTSLKLEFSTYDRFPWLRLDLAKTFLSRARNLPLELFLDARPPREAPDLSFVQHLIVPFSGTLHSLHTLLDIPLIQELLSLPADSLNQLTTLTLHTINNPSFPKDADLWRDDQPKWPAPGSVTVFTRSSPLKALYLSPNIPPAKILGQNQVLQLELLEAKAQLQYQDWHQLLRLPSCQSITRLFISVGISQNRDEDHAKKINLPGLTDLKVYVNSMDASPFLDALVLPHLRLFCLFGSARLSPSTYRSLQDRSGCQIERLELHDLNSDDIEPILEATASLKVFHLHGLTKFPGRLIAKIGQGEIGNNLVEFILWRGRRSVENLVIMLEMREILTGGALDQNLKSFSPLKYVKIESASDRKTDGLMQRICDLARIGVSLHVSNWPC